MKKAFSLSEVLIALVIIGVIAAITVPSVFADYREKEKSAKVKKIYSTLANAMTKVKAAGGVMDFDMENNSNQNIKSWYDTYLATNLVTTKTCYNTSGCWHNDDNLYLNGTESPGNRKGVGIGSNIVTAVLNDGTFINVNIYDASVITNRYGVNADSAGLLIFFDINGERKPNTIGRDVFAAVWTEDGFVPAYKDKTLQQKNTDCSSSGTGLACINKYLRQ